MAAGVRLTLEPLTHPRHSFRCNAQTPLDVDPPQTEISAELRAFMLRCFIHDPESRPHSHELMKDEWIRAAAEDAEGGEEEEDGNMDTIVVGEGFQHTEPTLTAEKVITNPGLVRYTHPGLEGAQAARQRRERDDRRAR